MSNSNQKAVVTPEIQKQLDALEKIKDNHSFWDNKLFKACKEGTLSKENWHYIFSQYYYYNKHFTRYITATMTNCENDYYRACLSENLWEEAGGAKPEDRHAEMFRKFLVNTLNIDLDDIHYQDFTLRFAEQYLTLCKENDAMYGSAFLSLGTEGMVARLYSIMIEGMEKSGIDSEELGFFHLHCECDDEHALTLAEMMASYADHPHWFATCEKALDDALTLRTRFFNNLIETIWLQGVEPIANNVIESKSTLNENSVVKIANNEGEQLYRNQDNVKNIDFNVTRLPVTSEVLDPRINVIQAGKNTENHKHGHETVIYILDGSGEFVIDNVKKTFESGDLIFVPRWSTHQTFNTGSTPLKFLAVTDYKLATKFIGNFETSYRDNKESAENINADAKIA